MPSPCVNYRDSIEWLPTYPRRRILEYTARGTPITKWVRDGMPRIDDALLDTVVYLYRTKEAAEKGEKAGGTGFILNVPLPSNPEKSVSFFVSNRHVVCTAGASVVRVNMKDGGIDIIETEPHEWIFTPRDDIAILPVSADTDMHKAMALPLQMCVTEEILINSNLGPGDDVFMVGRFIHHDGKQTNAPSVRFGNLSMLPSNIDHPTFGKQFSFAVEMRSFSGYSGSPVFIYPTPWDFSKNVLGPRPLYILGIDWGHIVSESDVREKVVKIQQDDAQDTDKTIQYVSISTGMSGVVPAWRLIELIDSSEAKAIIKEADDSELEKQRSLVPATELDTSAASIEPPQDTTS